jgi:hypothetical protein
MFISKNIVQTSMREDVSAHLRKRSTRSFVACVLNNALMCEKCLVALGS